MIDVMPYRVEYSAGLQKVLVIADTNCLLRGVKASSTSDGEKHPLTVHENGFAARIVIVDPIPNEITIVVEFRWLTTWLTNHHSFNLKTGELTS